MIKFLGLVCFGVIGILYLVFLGVIYLLSMVYLIISELLGTKRFNKKFIEIHKVIIQELKETIKTLIHIFDIA